MSTHPSLSPEEIRTHLDALRAHDLPTHGGRTLAYVYDSGLAEADAIGREVLASFSSTNGLDPTAFPSLLAMENDLVGVAGRLVDAPDGFTGVVTSGGTESILLAVLAARDGRPEVSAPRMVLPTTAHAAFHKAAHWLRVEPVFVDVDPVTKRADPRGDGSRDRRAHRARRRLRTVLRPRRHRPGRADRGRGRRSRGPVPCRRLHRRVGAPAPARRRARPAAVDLRVRGRHEPLARPAQVRLHPQGRLDPAARVGRAAPHPPLRLAPAGPATRCSTRRPSRRSPAARSPRPGPSSTTSAPIATSTSPARRARPRSHSPRCGERHTRPVPCGAAGLDAARR